MRMTLLLMPVMPCSPGTASAAAIRSKFQSTRRLIPGRREALASPRLRPRTLGGLVEAAVQLT
jgi:hypothetical protein